MDKNVECKFYKYFWLEQYCIFPISVFYPHFSVLSPFQRFILISAFYPHFSVLSSFQRFILISAFYPHFSVLSPFQRFIPLSAFYPPFSFRFQFPFPPFSFSVLSRPVEILHCVVPAAEKTLRLLKIDNWYCNAVL